MVIFWSYEMKLFVFHCLGPINKIRDTTVLPVTNGTSGRTFNLLNLIKSHLQSAMKQSRLSHLMILSAYKNQLDHLNLTKIASDFINKNDARKHIYGKFN